jgi:hypothetical protein
MTDPTAPPPSDPDLAAGREQQPRFPTLDEAAEFMRRTGDRWVPQGISAMVMREYDRRGEWIEKSREVVRVGQRVEYGLLQRALRAESDLAQARDRIAALEAVVGAARSLVTASESGSQTQVWIALDALAAAVRALEVEG